MKTMKVDLNKTAESDKLLSNGWPWHTGKYPHDDFVSNMANHWISNLSLPGCGEYLTKGHTGRFFFYIFQPTSNQILIF